MLSSHLCPPLNRWPAEEPVRWRHARACLALGVGNSFRVDFLPSENTKVSIDCEAVDVSCAVRVDCDVLDGSFYKTISLATVGNASWEWESRWPRPVVVFRARPPPPPQPPWFLRHLSLIMEIYLCLPTCFTHSYRDEVPVPCVEEVRKFLWCSVFSVKWF